MAGVRKALAPPPIDTSPSAAYSVRYCVTSHKFFVLDNRTGLADRGRFTYPADATRRLRLLTKALSDSSAP